VRPGTPAVLGLDLTLLPQRLAVCRLEAADDVPTWALAGAFFSVTRTSGHFSVVCLEADVPAGVRAEIGFRAFEVAGPLDFSLVGILSSMLEPLARAGIPVLAVSTYDTDDVLVRETDVVSAAAALRGAGHRVVGLR
jgi:hypothetical protein